MTPTSAGPAPSPGSPDEVIQRALARRLDHVVVMLETLLDMVRPGAAERGRRLAGSAVQLAERFEVPAIFVPDLALAARLHEVGMLADDAAGVSGDAWRFTIMAKRVLEHVEEFRGAASLIEALRENWDGSGLPARLQRGEIPFRSRILRVLMDFYAALDRAALTGKTLTPAEAAGRLVTHVGTWYDPVVVNQLEVSVGATSDTVDVPARFVVPVSELAPGMVLAEDLCTSSGVKLLSRGSTLTRGCVEIINQRHQIDPVISGAWVQRNVA